MTQKELKIEFAPGCFDNFDGTQEELDQLVQEIQKMFASGEFLEKAVPLDFDSMDPEDLEMFEHLAETEELAKGRTLQ